MPTILSAKMDGSPAVRFHHISLVSHYLGIAYDYAKIRPSEDNEPDITRAMIAITFSMMSLEAFANEAAEDLFPESELKAFHRLRGKFKKSPTGSELLRKLTIIFSERNHPPLPQALQEAIEAAVELRNTLVHYKLSDTAGKTYIEPMRGVPGSDGAIMWGLDLTKPPIQVDPPFISKVTPAAALTCYNTAYDFAVLWCMHNDLNDGPRGFQRL